jgi:hypothetical protein
VQRTLRRKLDWELRLERRRGNPKAGDLVDTICAMTASVRALGMKQQASCARHPQRVRLDES